MYLGASLVGGLLICYWIEPLLVLKLHVQYTPKKLNKIVSCMCNVCHAYVGEELRGRRSQQRVKHAPSHITVMELT